MAIEVNLVLSRVTPGQEPVELGPPYDDPSLAMAEAKKLNELAQVAGHGTPNLD
jgi:hypothetical protein